MIFLVLSVSKRTVAPPLSDIFVDFGKRQRRDVIVFGELADPQDLAAHISHVDFVDKVVVIDFHGIDRTGDAIIRAEGIDRRSVGQFDYCNELSLGIVSTISSADYHYIRSDRVRFEHLDFGKNGLGQGLTQI